MKYRITDTWGTEHSEKPTIIEGDTAAIVEYLNSIVRLSLTDPDETSDLDGAIDALRAGDWLVASVYLDRLEIELNR